MPATGAYRADQTQVPQPWENPAQFAGFAATSAALSSLLDAADIRAAVSVENGINANLAARPLGQLISVSGTRHMSILLSADYLQLRSALLAALRPHPEAMRDVSAAVVQLEADVARDITERARKPTGPQGAPLT